MSEVMLTMDDGIAVVTLSAPHRRNALTPAMALEFVAALDEIDGTDSVAVTIVRADGDSFCAGADLGLLERVGADPTDPDRYAELSAVYETFLRLRRLRTPSIAAVRGAAVGAGLNLVLAADIRVVSTTARLLCGFLRRGLHPGGGHFTLLERLVGRERAAAMSLFGLEIDGTRAVEAGLATAAVEPDDVDARALTLARRAAGDPELLRLAIRCFRDETDGPRLPVELASLAERSNQMWSMRRGRYAAGG